MRFLVLCLVVIGALAGSVRPPGWNSEHVKDHFDTLAFTLHDNTGSGYPDLVAADKTKGSMFDMVCPAVVYPFEGGVCNNLQNVAFGEGNRAITRLLTARYTTATGTTPRSEAQMLPNARAVSNGLSVLTADETADLNVKLTSFLLIYFGQFIDHDITLVSETEQTEGGAGDERFDITLAEGDIIDAEAIEFHRSNHVTENNVRTYVNQITPFLDLSSVYGDTEFALTKLTTRGDTTSCFPMLCMDDFFSNRPLEGFPYNETCGDVRCQENAQLFSLHTTFARNHNYWVRTLEANNASIADDTEVHFREAKRRNVGEYQRIVWEEYLPNLLGRERISNLGVYTYDSTVDPEVTLYFITAAFRYGHSGLAERITFNDNTSRAAIRLRETFFDVDESKVNDISVASMLGGSAIRPHGALDEKVIDSVRSFLFNADPETPSSDLVARNIQRGRDHGLRTFNEYRTQFGLPTITCDDMDLDTCYAAFCGNNTERCDTLETLYPDPEEIDNWIAGMMEPSGVQSDSLLGDTFTAILIDQFNRIRLGDRFWYTDQNYGATTPLGSATLAEIIVRNSAASSLSAQFLNRRYAMQTANPQLAWVIKDSAHFEWHYALADFDWRVVTVSSTNACTTTVVTRGSSTRLWTTVSGLTPETDYCFILTNGTSESDIGEALMFSTNLISPAAGYMFSAVLAIVMFFVNRL